MADKNSTYQNDKKLRDGAAIPVRQAKWKSVREFLNGMLRAVAKDPKRFTKDKFGDAK